MHILYRKIQQYHSQNRNIFHIFIHQKCSFIVLPD
nr:MAG TPA: hypothetical protein [Caudoviricetes sp.]